MTNALQWFWRVVDFPFKLAAYLLIQAYRYSLSMFMGRNCRHAPSCSEFTRDAIWRFGSWPGGWMGLARIYRCRPRGSHGYDPVPDKVPTDAHWNKPWRYGAWQSIPHYQHHGEAE